VQAPAHGRCEVVVYSSDANRDLLTIGEERRRLLVRVWIDRYAELFNRGLDYVLPFENRGEEVGVTLTHPHGQIYAFGRTPQLQAHAASVFANGYDLSAHLRDWRGEFGVTGAGGLLAFAPPFARFPYETWIAPLSPHAGPWSFSAEEIEGFAYLIGEMTRRYDALFGRKTPFMLTLHAAPRGPSPNYCFTAQFYPLLRAPGRLKYLASVEQATGMFTVDVMPERAAMELRAQ
jgi:UDPglucose--hexose-1-phosphate uridylyltransferase